MLNHRLKKNLFFYFVILTIFLFFFFYFSPHLTGKIGDTIFKKIRNAILTANINLTVTIGMTKNSLIFQSDTARAIDVVSPDNTKLTISIPANITLIAEEIETSIVSLRKNDILRYFPMEERQIGVGPIYQFAIEKTADVSAITSFANPVLLTFFYTESDIEEVEEREIKAYYWNESQSKWVALDGSVAHPTENKVTAPVSHSSMFGIFGPPLIRYFSSGLKPPVTAPLIPVPAVTKKKRGDINNDGNVNLIDFSIMAYWWKRPVPDLILPQIDLNGDKQLTLIDFSILAYWWGK